jgi:ribosomal protein L14E/L6E/L27E
MAGHRDCALNGGTSKSKYKHKEAFKVGAVVVVSRGRRIGRSCIVLWILGDLD